MVATLKCRLAWSDQRPWPLQGFPAWHARHALMMTGDSEPEMSGEARVMMGARMDPYRSVLVLGLCAHHDHLVWEAQGIGLLANGAEMSVRS